MNDGAAAESRRRGPIPEERDRLRRDVEALRRRCGLLEAPWEALLIVDGEEAAPFLHGLLTQEILAQAPGTTVPAALADRKGHWRADLWVHRSPDRFFLRVRVDRLASLTETFERHRFAERVAWRVEPVEQPFLLLGPEAPDLWARLLGLPADLEAGDTEGGSLPAPFLGRWMRVREIGPRDLVVFPAPGSGDPLRRALAASGEVCVRVGEPAFHLLRIEAGTPWFGLDGDEERLVPEVVPDDRVNDRKGCYLGQETIARTRWRGGVRRRLARLLIEGDEPVAPGTLLRDEAGESLGRLLSSAPRPDGRRLAFVLRELPRGPGVEESMAPPRPCGEVVTETGRSGRWWEPDATGYPTLI